MGYRLRLGRVSKKDYEKYKDKSYEEMCKLFGENDGENDYFPSYRPEFHEQLYELGKGVNYNDDDVKNFYSFDIEEEEFFIVDKDFLEKIINSYKDIVQKYYLEMHKNIKAFFEDENSNTFCAVKPALLHVESMSQEWNCGMLPYSINAPMKDGKVTTSWKYEYSIFNLVQMYWNFDWENDLLIYSGW
jgi:hypothetical protein